PKTLGIKNALRVSLLLHVIMVALLLLLTRYTTLGSVYLLGVCVTAVLLFYEHSLVKPDDLSRVDVAFFTVNGFISLALMVFTLIDIFVS
ncbi:MAG: 4-hydroxybenzoate octaprenyltransferase, partial [Candidatus Brocadiales bacterium]|nr:4-hydroxybenzoate octaprenyltransferase [Candidatus Bathyanammoxibius sp.]